MPRRHAILIGLIVLVYIAARLWRLTDSCLWFDEIFSIHAANHSWSRLISFVAKDLIHPPLSYFLLKIWISVGGEGLFWLRLFPVIFAVLALIPLWMLCRELKLKPLAVTVTFALFAVNGALIKYAQEVRMYSLLMLLSLASIWLFSRYYFRGKSFWALTILNILLVYTHYFGWFVVATEVLVILVFQRIKILRTLLMFGVTAAAFVPWVYALFHFAEPGSSVSQNIGWMQRPGVHSLLDFAFDLVDPLYFQQSNAEPAAGYLIAFPFLVVLFAAALLYVLRFGKEKNKERFYFLSAFVIFPLVVVFAASWVLPVSLWGSRHLIIVFAPTIVIFAIFLTEIEIPKVRDAMLAILLLLVAAAFAFQLRAAPPQYIWCTWQKLAEEIPTDKPQTVYVFEDLIAYHLWYATRGKPVTIFKVDEMPDVREDKAYFLPRGFDEVRKISPDEIEGRNFWLAFRKTAPDERHSPVDHFLERGYTSNLSYSIEADGGTAILVQVNQK